MTSNKKLVTVWAWCVVEGKPKQYEATWCSTYQAWDVRGIGYLHDAYQTKAALLARILFRTHKNLSFKEIASKVKALKNE